MFSRSSRLVSMVPSMRKRRNGAIVSVAASRSSICGFVKSAAWSCSRAAPASPSCSFTSNPTIAGRASCRRSANCTISTQRSRSSASSPSISGEVRRNRKMSGASPESAARIFAIVAGRRASRRRIVPRPVRVIDCQPMHSSPPSCGRNTSASKNAFTRCVLPAPLWPSSTIRGARLRRNSFFTGSSSARIGFCNGPGSLVTSRSNFS